MKQVFMYICGAFVALMISQNAAACASCVDLFECDVEDAQLKKAIVSGNMVFEENQNGEHNTYLGRLKIGVYKDGLDGEWFYLEEISDELRNTADNNPEQLRFAAVTTDGKAAQISRKGTKGRLVLLGEKIQRLQLKNCKESSGQDRI